jgi:hypothetical protein
MNGTGKSGIYANPSGGFVAKTNTLVKLAVRAPSGAAILRDVQYGNETLSHANNSFTLTIQPGINLLAVHIQSPAPEFIELLDSEEHLLAQFDSVSASFTIKGE